MLYNYITKALIIFTLYNLYHIFYIILINIIQIGHKNRLDEKKKLTAEEVVAIVKDVFVIATERDIYTGDSVEIKLIKKDGITTEIFPLKTD